MKKVMSLLFLLYVIYALSNIVFARDTGEYITETRIIKEEIKEIKAELKEVKIAKGFKQETKIDGLNFTTTVKGFNYNKEYTGVLEKAEGIQEKIISNKLTLIFELKEIIVQEKEEKLFYIGYKDSKGCKVMFNEKLELTDKKVLDKKKPFISGKSKKWTNKIYLYRKGDWVCSTPEVTPENTPEVTPEVTPENTQEITTETIPETTPEVTIEVTPENTSELPKTGENHPIRIIILGILILGIGLTILIKVRKA